MKVGNIEVYGVIYLIRNRLNGKVYVGQTTHPFKIRYSGGKWWEQSHNVHLKSAVQKYGIDSFDLMENYDVAFSKQELDIKEIIYINLHMSNNREYGYNKRSGGANGKHSKESKIKMSRAHKGTKLSFETRLKMSVVRKGTNVGESNPMYGKNPYANLSEEAYSNLLQFKSRNMTGINNPMYGAYGELNPFYGRQHSEETKKILSEKAKQRLSEHNPLKGRKIPQNNYGCNPNSKHNIKVFNSHMELLHVFDSVKRCAEWMIDVGMSNTYGGAKDALRTASKRDNFYKGHYFIKESKNKQS